MSGSENVEFTLPSLLVAPTKNSYEVYGKGSSAPEPSNAYVVWSGGMVLATVRRGPGVHPDGLGRWGWGDWGQALLYHSE